MASFSEGFIELCIAFAIGRAVQVKNSKRRAGIDAVAAIFNPGGVW
jgi:uncharacterized membrane protein